MSELQNEIRQLAEQIAACPDDTVADIAYEAAQIYRKERLIALGLAAVDSMINDGPEEISEVDPRLIKVLEQFRDRLKGILNWAKTTGRM